jgi:hypothetical protein
LQFDPRLTWDGVGDSPEIVHDSTDDEHKSTHVGSSSVK